MPVCSFVIEGVSACGSQSIIIMYLNVIGIAFAVDGMTGTLKGNDSSLICRHQTSNTVTPPTPARTPAQINRWSQHRRPHTVSPLRPEQGNSNCRKFFRQAFKFNMTRKILSLVCRSPASVGRFTVEPQCECHRDDLGAAGRAPAAL